MQPKGPPFRSLPFGAGTLSVRGNRDDLEDIKKRIVRTEKFPEIADPIKTSFGGIPQTQQFVLDADDVSPWNRVCFGLSCGSQDTSEYSCSRDVILAIDATTNMGTLMGIRAEFDFIENWILPRLDIRSGYVNIGMTTYGTGFPSILRTGSTTIYDFSATRSQICVNLEKLWSGVDIETANNVPLSRTIRNLFNNFGFDYTSLVLFTGDRDQADVDAAGAQVEYYIANRLAVEFSVVIVNYGNCSFSSWPSPHTDEYDANVIPADQLSKFVDDSICGVTTTSPAVPNHLTSTAIPATSSAPDLPVASTNNSGCNCVLSTVWLDVFLVMEASVSMAAGIDGATDYVVSAMSKLTVGQAEQYQTRFGVIRYATSVELISDLNVYKTTADLFDLAISPLNETGTNIEGAIRLATTKFMSSTHRAAARPVLIIVGSSYRAGGYIDPTQAAGEFKEDGGTIITIGELSLTLVHCTLLSIHIPAFIHFPVHIEYVQQHGLTVPMLRTIASPNYNLTNQKDDGTQLRADELRQLLCEANCFCQKNWLPYNEDPWKAPQGGCYFQYSISSIQVIL
ncbi:unnamed protein product [Heligmosomoides polygyrus]|uniref:VWFA domain-containing protein n=1 Tax=Heligmosomoides polygyrus TaxID=6339 RepID=A0A183FFI5_HELPZ|nr:unnamed protein product [Heligmosomoides polygyrus]